MNRERKAIEYQIKFICKYWKRQFMPSPEKGGIFEHVLIGWNDVEILNTTAMEEVLLKKWTVLVLRCWQYCHRSPVSAQQLIRLTYYYPVGVSGPLARVMNEYVEEFNAPCIPTSKLYLCILAIMTPLCRRSKPLCGAAILPTCSS